MRKLLCAALLSAACGGLEGEFEAEEAAAVAHPPRHLYTLEHAPVPGPYPTALVHLARGFRASGPLNLVVHFHGWNNCIANDAEATSSRCRPNGPVRTAHNLIGQIDASGANAVLVAVERTFDQANSADGRLAEPGFFRGLVLELLPHIGALAGRGYAEADLGKIVLSSHSGGYVAVGDILAKGGLPIAGVILLDSLYGSIGQHEAWVRGDLGRRRLAVVYTSGGGTLSNSQAFATRAAGWLRAAGLPSSLLFDERYSRNYPPSTMDAPLYFYKSSLSHSGCALYWFWRLLGHQGLE